MDYGGLIWIMDYRALSWINRAYDGLWTIMEYYGLLWHIVDDRGLSWVFKYAPPWNRMDYKICLPKPLTTPERCGAGMAHTVPSIGHVLSCYYCGL